MYTNEQTHIYIHTYIHTYIQTNIYINIYIYIHTIYINIHAYKHILNLIPQNSQTHPIEFLSMLKKPWDQVFK